MTMLLLPEDTKGNKQKACTSHFKSTSGQQFRDQSISIGGGGGGSEQLGGGSLDFESSLSLSASFNKN